ncbi:MAG TPA: hypothetical protein VHD60_04335 [Candidatus Saccharimonadales bacterium]|nr:hypothetical protein [Candidatus Saccharimonadales bacterium]
MTNSEQLLNVQTPEGNRGDLSEPTPAPFANEILHMRLQIPEVIPPAELHDDVLAREIAIRSQQIVAHQLALRDLLEEQRQRAQS